jgi:cytochrome c peroxidase
MKRGEVMFDDIEIRGYRLFTKHCNACHTEPLFTNQGFENNGLAIDSTLNDMGRSKVTHQAADERKFKVPTLRNIEVSYPYMHDGRFKNLAMVLFHYSNGIAPSATLSTKLRKGIPLDEQQKRELIAFLKTLTDEEFLHDPRFLPKE